MLCDGWMTGDSMLVDVGDSEAESVSEASSDASVPAPAIFDDSLPVVAPPDELFLDSGNDAKDRSENACKFILNVNKVMCLFLCMFVGLSVNRIISEWGPCISPLGFCREI